MPHNLPAFKLASMIANDATPSPKIGNRNTRGGGTINNMCTTGTP